MVLFRAAHARRFGISVKVISSFRALDRKCFFDVAVVALLGGFVSASTFVLLFFFFSENLQVGGGTGMSRVVRER